MKDYNFGDIVLLSFPFADSISNKKRPAMVILDTEDGDIILARITSKIKESKYDSEIKEWKQAGLLFSSTIRLHKIATISKEHIERKLGNVAKDDLDIALKVIQEIINPN